MTGCIDDWPDDVATDAELDPDRLAVCAYWRCEELFETRSVNHRYCRKACRSRQKKWERAQRRRAERERAKRMGRAGGTRQGPPGARPGWVLRC